MIPATDTEVEKALIKEAKRRGYKKGVEVIPFNIKIMSGEPIKTTIFSCDFNLSNYDMDDALWIKSGKWTSVIYQGGKWAEIIQIITKLEAEKITGKTIVG